jgi:hypothetical protein
MRRETEQDKSRRDTDAEKKRRSRERQGSKLSAVQARASHPTINQAGWIRDPWGRVQRQRGLKPQNQRKLRERRRSGWTV